MAGEGEGEKPERKWGKEAFSHNIALHFLPCLFTFASPIKEKIHKCSANRELEVANVRKTKGDYYYYIIVPVYKCNGKKINEQRKVNRV